MSSNFAWDELVVSSAPVVAHLLSGSDRAEDLDAAHELPCGHLPLDECRCGTELAVLAA